MPINKNTNEWGQLSMKDKADLISIYSKHGYTNIDDIRKDYESNRDRFLNSNANFVKRLRDNDTTSIALENGDSGTHLMTYAEGDNQSTIYPSIQESNGTLVNHKGEKLDGYFSAAENKDTVNVSKPFAEFYTPNYKNDFKEFFDKFAPNMDGLKYMNEKFMYDNRDEENNVYANGGEKENKKLNGVTEVGGSDVDWYRLQNERPDIYKYNRPNLPQKLSFRDFVYNIGVNSQVDAKVELNDIFNYGKNNEDYVPTIYAYIYGPDKVYNKFSGESNGFDYSNYLKKAGYNNIGEYNGLFNYDNIYTINSRYKGLVDELAKNNAHIYDNADLIESDYRDDIGAFIHRFTTDKNGNSVISDSDVYDFYSGDKKFNNPLYKLEYKLMDKIGHPYILRQDNIPIQYDRNSYNDIDEILDDMSYEDIAKLTNSGYIKPAVIKANKY